MDLKTKIRWCEVWSYHLGSNKQLTKWHLRLLQEQEDQKRLGEARRIHTGGKNE